MWVEDDFKCLGGEFNIPGSAGVWTLVTACTRRGAFLKWSWGGLRTGGERAGLAADEEAASERL